MSTPLSVPRLYLVRDLFLFSCYTGISYGDMCRLTAANLETAEDGTVWIKAAREKTNVEFEIPLLDLPLHIIDKYRDTTSDGKLLPMYGNSELNKGIEKPCYGLRYRPQTDLSQGAAQLRNAYYPLAGRADRDRQPHDGTPAADDDPNLCPCNGREGGRGYEATTKTVRKPKNRTL